MLYHSLHQKLLRLPDETLIYPAHGAGSLCGKNLSRETFSTIGVQRQYNYALQPMSQEEFTRVVTAEQPDPPAYFTYDAVLNTKERPTLDRTLEQSLKPLTLDELIQLKDADAQLLDVRDPGEFAGAHLSGSLNIGLGGQFATWAGTLLNRDRPIVIIASPGREKEAATRLGRIGFDHVAGYLDDGMNALESSPGLLQQNVCLAATTVAEQLASPSPPLIVDVRTEKERRENLIDGSLHIPLNHLRERAHELPNGRALVVHCAAGYRSSIAVSLLKRDGRPEVFDLLGGLAAWEKSALPTIKPQVKRSATVKPTEYSEKITELAGWKVRLTSYRLGNQYYCKADNIEPGACIARSQGATKEEAEREAIAKSEKYLSQTRRFQA
jgi:rhodanese-related sulfurtransferase